MVVGFAISLSGCTGTEKGETHKIHSDHPHKHGPNCGHKAVKHGNHVDYLHDGHYHHVHGNHVDEHGEKNLGEKI